MMYVFLFVLGFSGLFKGTVNFRVREAYTGRRMSCEVSVFKGKERILKEHIDGEWNALLKRGNYRFVFTKNGYFPVSAYFLVKRDTVLNVTVYLSPENVQGIFPPEVDGLWIVRGYVTDKKGNPLRGVKVRISSKNMGTVTDENGVFELALPKEHIKITHDFMPKDTVILMKDGYKTYYKEIFHLEENVVLRISMEKGSGVIFKRKNKSPGTGNVNPLKNVKKNK